MECVMVCGVDCHQGDENCNGYCIGKAVSAKTYTKADQKEIWLVLDADGWPIYCAGWPNACHEHINDAINEHELDEAAQWKVRRAELVPNVEVTGLARLHAQVPCEPQG